MIFSKSSGHPVWSLDILVKVVNETGDAFKPENLLINVLLSVETFYTTKLVDAGGGIFNQ